jgi:hypothetical protein
MNTEVRIYEVSLRVRIFARSEAEAEAIGYNLLLGRSQSQATSDTAEQPVSQANLDALFEDEPKANLDGLFEDEPDAA